MSKNLLYKASIVTTPTAYGVEVLNSIKPALSYGSELVTNGDFSDGSTDWTTQSSWSISGGKANYDAVTTQHYLKQTMSSIAAGKTVKIQFDILDVEAGKDAFFKIECSGDPEKIFPYTKFSEGTYTYYHKITSGLDRLNFVPLNTSTGGSFSIDNVSVKEVITADFDFTRSSTATRVNSDYLIETSATNTPRLDYHNGTASILLEPQSTNLLIQSEQNLPTIQSEFTPNLIISPNGNLTMGAVESTSSNGQIRLDLTVGSGSTTISGYFKAKNTNWLRIQASSFDINSHVYFDLLNGVIGTETEATGTIEHFKDGIYKCSITFSTTTDLVGLAIFYGLRGDLTSSALGDSVYLWGLQAESLPYPTSYIPTSGTTQTRAAEDCYFDRLSDYVGVNEGTLLIKGMTPFANGSSYFFDLSDGINGSTNRIAMYTAGSTPNLFYLWTGSPTLITLSNETEVNIAISWSGTEVKLYLNGVLNNTITSSSKNPTKINLNRRYTNANIGNSKFKCVAVFNEALTDTELACLTGTNDKEIFLNYYYRMQYVGANTEALGCAEQTFNI